VLHLIFSQGEMKVMWDKKQRRKDKERERRRQAARQAAEARGERPLGVAENHRCFFSTTFVPSLSWQRIAFYSTK